MDKPFLSDVQHSSGFKIFGAMLILSLLENWRSYKKAAEQSTGEHWAFTFGKSLKRIWRRLNGRSIAARTD